MSRMPITRRQPAIAFCASVSTWVPIWTGPTNRVTRNAKASTSPEVMSPASAEPDADDQHAGVGQARPRPRRGENENAVSPWARVAATWLTEIASSMRSWVRFSIA